MMVMEEERDEGNDMRKKMINGKERDGEDNWICEA